MRVLVCGSRDYGDAEQMYRILDGLLLEARVRQAVELRHDRPAMTIVHGAARGADSLAARWANQVDDVWEEAYPADWDEYGKRAGYIRNQQMIETFPDLVIAFFAGERTKGTQHTCDLARRFGLELWEVFSYRKSVTVSDYNS